MSAPGRKAGGLYGGINLSSTGIPPAPIIEAAPVPPPPKTRKSRRKNPKKKRVKSPQPKPSAPRLPAGAFTTLTTTAPAAFTSGPSSSSVSAAAVIYAPPSLNANAAVAQPEESAGPGAPGWGKKVKPPSMVLDVDVNGFKAATAKKRSGRGKKSKNNNTSTPAWDPDEQYDPLRPNDYNEYKVYKEKQREERIRAREGQRRLDDRKRSRRSRSYSGSSDDYSDDDEDRYPARPKKTGRYDELPGQQSWRTREPEPIYEDSYPPPPVPLDDGEAAYLRQSPPPHIPPPALSSGEEAYLRRLAMSTAAVRPVIEREPSPPLPPPTTIPDVPAPSFNPPTAPPSLPADVEAQIKQKREAAAAIAARLGQMVQQAEASGSTPGGTEPLPAPASDDKPDPHAGQGLGVDASGMVETPQREKGACIGGGKVAKIINKHEDERTKEDRARYGEPSTIVILSNMDLRDEIGDECSKHGVVNRVFVHVVNPIPVNHDEAVRIFVQFAGPVGAWKTVRELDGRFFGGRTVRARYFPEAIFAQHLLDGPLDG
ncbi:hypothetical protein BS47DRAFT_1373291 [Hydnum rufescens UP504]|uniref:RNA recognition motif domain-containing protein n=1 Tax=Hydnum rufescens UP504 TaxID=1448309 RepID=A0A9P6DQ16_9AGAM|nr:hypothetical protein BS47DRAFT_1373291 [Hydnum rufescens UP504]